MSRSMDWTLPPLSESPNCLPCTRFSAPFSGSAFELYRRLRQINPSPYTFFMSFGELTIMGSSPELLIRCEDGLLQLRPIAGTRVRGATESEDQALAEELLADEKERAEHVMLVDLGRNDLGRIAAPGPCMSTSTCRSSGFPTSCT